MYTVMQRLIGGLVMLLCSLQLQLQGAVVYPLYPSQSAALSYFYTSTHGAQWKTSCQRNWNDFSHGNPCNSWYRCFA